MASANKIFRFIISLLLIFVLASPLCASNTSTPDAFISKKEFDEALSDFNQRLTRFEAGVNSKIDSQVSSYLDRNGIWSKKEQDIKNSYHMFMYGGGLTTTGADSVTTVCDLDGKTYNNLNFKTYVASTADSSINYGQENVQLDLRETIVEKVNKSGMIVIEYKYAPLTQAFRTWYKNNLGTKSNYIRLQANKDGNAATGGFGVTSSLGFEGVKVTGEVFDIKKDSFIRGGVVDGWDKDSWSNYYTIAFLGGTNTSMGFVDKGDRLDYVVNFAFVGNSANGISTAKRALVTTGDVWFTGMMMVITDINVY